MVYNADPITNKDKEVFLQIEQGKIVAVEFYYTDDITHKYMINFKKSGIENINIVKQEYNMVKHDGHIYASLIDPVFVVKY